MDIPLCLNSLDIFAKRIIISFVKLVAEVNKGAFIIYLEGGL